MLVALVALFFVSRARLYGRLFAPAHYRELADKLPATRAAAPLSPTEMDALRPRAAHSHSSAVGKRMPIHWQYSSACARVIHPPRRLVSLS